VTLDKGFAHQAGIDIGKLYLAMLFILCGEFLQIKIRLSKYLNNTVKQDHRFIKKLTQPRLHWQELHFTIGSKKAIPVGKKSGCI
jgi:putative transposase